MIELVLEVGIVNPLPGAISGQKARPTTDTMHCYTDFYSKQKCICVFLYSLYFVHIFQNLEPVTGPQLVQSPSIFVHLSFCGFVLECLLIFANATGQLICAWSQWGLEISRQ